MNALPALKICAAILCLATLPVSVPAASANASSPTDAGPVFWQDPTQPIAVRVHDLISRMTLEEKVSELSCDSAAIPRLGVPAYSHRNECLHGIVGNPATVFPEPIGMAATWNTPLIHAEADAIATEARARHNDYVAQHNGDSGHRFGVSFYAPNINIFRDPRWGRGQETYGEDPFLTAQFGVAFIQGLQGDDPKYIKIMACAKHYVVHSGPEPERHTLDARPPERDLYETYLPAFEAAVREGHVGSVMGAYSALNGVPDCANSFLLTDLLRKQWGFDGFVVSDGGAIWDIWAEHKYGATPAEAAAEAVMAGCDLASGNVGTNQEILAHSTNWVVDTRGWLHGGEDFNFLVEAVHAGLISEDKINTAVDHELTALFRLGEFDPPALVPWSKITPDQIDTPEHRALALKVAEESLVLLKNNGALPLDRSRIKKIAVIGPNAASARMLLGNYEGTPSESVNILEGIKAAAGPGITVTYQRGCPLALRNDGKNQPGPDLTTRAIAAAQASDVVIFVSGIDSSLESEEASEAKDNFQGFHRGDRTRIELPAVQEDLLKALAATGKPVILVNCSGCAMAMPWENDNLSAILQAWYPGEAGGRAVAEALFGDINPAGRLPITLYASTADLPAFDDYSMTNRTYRYFSGQPLYAFGHGLSYTQFAYNGAAVDKATLSTDETATVSFTLTNVGQRDGDEVAQVYFRHVESAMPQPRLALCGFARVHVAKGESTTVNVKVPAERMRYWDTTQKQYLIEPGHYELLIGAASDDIRQKVPLTVD